MMWITTDKISYTLTGLTHIYKDYFAAIQVSRLHPVKVSILNCIEISDHCSSDKHT